MAEEGHKMYRVAKALPYFLPVKVNARLLDGEAVFIDETFLNVASKKQLSKTRFSFPLSDTFCESCTKHSLDKS